MAASQRGHHMQDSPAPGCIRFGPFELDARSGELRNGDTRQHLSDQPLAILKALIERPGELVGRDELRQRLWPDGTFVGFDHGLNSAINRLREALHDSADSPGFIETIPRRGYRLLVPIEVIGPRVPSTLQDAPLPSAAPAPGEVSIEVDRAVEPGGGLHKPVGHGRPSKVLAWIAPAAIGVLSLGWLLSQSREGPHAPLIANVAIDLPAGWQTNKSLSPAISPDSQYIALSASHPSGGSGIWLRPLAGNNWRMLNHTENGSAPFWSPDGGTIGFFAGGKLKILNLAEGSVRVICDASPGTGAWMSPRTVLFGPGGSGGVVAVNVETREIRDVTWIDRESGDISHGSPAPLFDGSHFVYVAKRKDISVAMLASLETYRAASLGPVQSHVLPTVSGDVLFVRDGALLAQRMDVTSGRLAGNPKTLAEGLTARGWSQAGRFSVSSAMLVYQETVNPFPLSEVTIFDRSGKATATLGEMARYSSPSLSPDETRLAIAMSQPSSPARDIWVFDLRSGNRTHLADDPHDDLAPRWSADGRWVIYTSDRTGERAIYKRLASGEGSDELVFEGRGTATLNDWSSDGRFVVYDTGAFNGIALPDLGVADLAGDRRANVLADGAGAQHQADISPDGRFVAYASSQSERYEIVVETFPTKGGRWTITTKGGQNPTWRRDMRELFYSMDDTVVALDINAGAGPLEWSAAKHLFRIPNFTIAPVRGLTVSAMASDFSRSSPKLLPTHSG
jgi:eukaryotic-like serine/threonine-protein kinase